jgi:hypothetical protein
MTPVARDASTVGQGKVRHSWVQVKSALIFHPKGNLGVETVPFIVPPKARVQPAFTFGSGSLVTEVEEEHDFHTFLR